jgi:flagellar biogenesis protein FliO
MFGFGDAGPATAETRIGGLAGWLLKRLQVGRHTAPRLAVLERIALAPRQSLALIEAEGRRFLIATSPEGTPAFYALEASVRSPRREGNRDIGAVSGTPAQQAAQRSARVSW